MTIEKLKRKTQTCRHFNGVQHEQCLAGVRYHDRIQMQIASCFRWWRAVTSLHGLALRRLLTKPKWINSFRLCSPHRTRRILMRRRKV